MQHPTNIGLQQFGAFINYAVQITKLLFSYSVLHLKLLASVDIIFTDKIILLCRTICGYHNRSCVSKESCAILNMIHLKELKKTIKNFQIEYSVHELR